MKKLIYFIIFLSNALFAQEQAAIWYFGENAGLDFNSGVPVALTDGQLNTLEGCATIADATGSLLFYTDGITVWNRNHIPMPNGTGLLGNPSSTQSGIIVPYPGNIDLYYVFTIHDAGEPEGLQYSMVDMSLNSGLGDVTTKNIPLATPVAEKLTAVEHVNGTDIWVVAHGYGNNDFLGYLVTPTGLVTTPVVSSVGEILPIAPNGQGTRGYMKISPDGQFLVSITTGTRLRELFRFDSFSGQVSNAIDLNPYFLPLIPPNAATFSYGAEFSSDSSKLYVTYTNFYLNYTQEHSIHQFDMSSYSAPAILASGVEIAPIKPGGVGALQLAIDGKIYVAEFEKNYLSVINNPNLGGLASDYSPNSVPLLFGTSLSGLPPFIQSFFVVGLRARNFCLGDATEFEVTSSDPILNIAWDFGDGNTSILETPSHMYTTAGDYTVSVTVTTSSETKTETKDITIFETPIATQINDLESCIEQNTYSFDLSTLDVSILGIQNPTNFVVSYYLSQADADANSNLLATTYDFPLGSTEVYARVSNSNNTACFDTTQFNVIAQQEPTLGTVTDWTICDDDLDGFYTFDLTEKNAEIFNGQDESVFEVDYFASQAEADTGSNPLPVNYTNTLPSEEIFVRLENSSHIDCYKTESFIIEVSSGVVANTPSNLEMCDDNNDGLATFTLSDTETEIIGTQSSTSLAISYHTTMVDAESGSNAIANIFTNTTAYNQSIYTRVQNTSNTSCYDITSFDLIIFESPQIQTVADWNVCDDDNDEMSLFDLNQKTAEILGNQSSVDFTVHYYENLADANLAQNEINGVYQNTSNPQTIYFSIENNGNATCRGTDSFEIEVYNTPFVQAPTLIIICDDNETGVQTIDLTQKDVEILGSQSAADFNVRYYTSQADAENDTNAINADGYSSSQNQETIFARVQPNNLDSCYATTSFEIIINSLPQINVEKRYVICPDSPALVIDGGDFESWSWQNSAGVELSTFRNFNVSDLGAYQLTVSQIANGVRCENSQSFEVLSSGAPETMEVKVNGFSDQIDITINATGTGPFEYSVNGENYQVSNEFIVFPGKHTVFVRDLEECRVLSEEIIALGFQRFFTPNGDGSNEYWNIIGGELYPDSQLFIYDRYGKFLKQISPTSKGWDGLYNGVSLPESDYWFKYTYGDNELITGHFTLKR